MELAVILWTFYQYFRLYPIGQSNLVDCCPL